MNPETVFVAPPSRIANPSRLLIEKATKQQSLRCSPRLDLVRLLRRFPGEMSHELRASVGRFLDIGGRDSKCEVCGFGKMPGVPRLVGFPPFWEEDLPFILHFLPLPRDFAGFSITGWLS